MNSDSLNMVSRLGEGHMPCTFFLSEPQLKTTVRLYLQTLKNVCSKEITHIVCCIGKSQRAELESLDSAWCKASLVMKL